MLQPCAIQNYRLALLAPDFVMGVAGLHGIANEEEGQTRTYATIPNKVH